MRIMEIALVVLIIVVSVLLMVFIIVYNRRKNEEMRYYAAAGNILREDFLNYSLQNHLAEGDTVQEPGGRKTMLYLKSKNNKDARFVFDPEKGVNIGRDKHNSNIYINDHAVSQKHCRICVQDSGIILKDCNSANGTLLLRGLFGKYNLTGGAKAWLQNGDRIVVGPCTFKVVLFFYDMTQMS